MTSSPTIAEAVERLETAMSAPASVMGGVSAVIRLEDVRTLLAAFRRRGEALEKIADGRVGPDQAGHYLAHREAVKIARQALKDTPNE